MVAHQTTAQNFPDWPVFSEDEIEAACRVLRSGRVNYWTGTEGREFEREFAKVCNVDHAVAVANGTVALEAALAVLGVGPGDEVITSSRTFIASASAVVMRGATPVVADIDRSSQNITGKTIAPLITKRTKAILVVHLAGWPCEMHEIVELARSRGVFVIEDCAQAVGARFDGVPVGGIGDIGAFSFCQDKILTTAGEGGMLVTNNEERWLNAWALKDHGKSYKAVFECDHPPGFRWLHESFGTNWRMTEVQAAVGRRQLRKLDDWLAKRAANAAFLSDALKEIASLRVPVPPNHVRHAWYKFYAFVEPSALRKGKSRDWIMAEINARGVPCFSGICGEIYREKAFTKMNLAPAASLPVARELGETSLMFLVHPTLGINEMERTCDIVRDVMRLAAR